MLAPASRITLTYEQALMSLRHFPDVWLELAAWHEAEGRGDTRPLLSST